jgi:glutathione S-transferase
MKYPKHYKNGEIMNLTLIYFDFPFWRAEVSRIALHIGNIEFNDIRVTRDEFIRAKETGKLDNGTIIPFHQFPCLIIENEVFAQTAGIARYCGKLSGLYPKKNDVLGLKIDQFLDLMTDITVLIFNVGRNENPEQKKIKRKEFFNTEFNRKLKMLETNISDDSRYIIKDNFNIADIALWSFVNWITSGTIDGFPKDFLKNFPKIKKVFLEVNAIPELQKWVKKTYQKE